MLGAVNQLRKSWKSADNHKVVENAWMNGANEGSEIHGWDIISRREETLTLTHYVGRALNS